jgi:hypothetical protein
MELFVIFGILGLIVAMCWKFPITPSLLAFIGVISLTLCCLAFVGVEKFIQINNDTLEEAGIKRPSVFNCMNEIGRTAEMNYLFAIPEADIF